MSLESMKNEACTVLVTCGDQAEAEKIAATIVKERLAACTNLVPGIQSFYMWEEEFQTETEILLIIKTTPETLPKLENRVRELHSYAVPEFLALPVTFGGQSYIEWIKNNVR